MSDYTAAGHDPKERYIPQHLRNFVYRRDGGRCRYCGRSVRFIEWHCDHVWPFSLGGLTVAENLVLACEDCNLRKSDRLGLYPKPLDYWHLQRQARAVHFPFASALLVFVGVTAAALSFALYDSTLITTAGAGLAVAGVWGAIGWQNGRGSR